jgi:hypothetical protein
MSMSKETTIHGCLLACLPQLARITLDLVVSSPNPDVQESLAFLGVVSRVSFTMCLRVIFPQLWSPSALKTRTLIISIGPGKGSSGGRFKMVSTRERNAFNPGPAGGGTRSGSSCQNGDGSVALSYIVHQSYQTVVRQYSWVHHPWDLLARLPYSGYGTCFSKYLWTVVLVRRES